jgi:hypothetical protein
MNRRQLLASLIAAAAAPAQMWEPSRTIVLPPKGGWPQQVLIRVGNRTGYDRSPLSNVAGPPVTREQIMADIESLVSTLSRTTMIPIGYLRRHYSLSIGDGVPTRIEDGYAIPQLVVSR